MWTGAQRVRKVTKQMPNPSFSTSTTMEAETLNKAVARDKNETPTTTTNSSPPSEQDKRECDNDISPCALTLAGGNEILAYNLQFRCGPCNICGGSCLCLNDDLLIQRLLSGLKPVGSFARRELRHSALLEQQLNQLGLTTWGPTKNRWGMYMVVACKYPDVDIPLVGTPRNQAFTMNFINEYLTTEQTGALYGYPSLCVVEINSRSSKTFL